MKHFLYIAFSFIHLTAFCQNNDSLKRYYKSGVLEYEAWHNELGKEHGTVNYYHPNGQLELTFTAFNGIPIGTATRYWPNGDLMETITYNEAGEIIQTAKFHNPPTFETAPRIQDGKWKQDGYNVVLKEQNEVLVDGIFRNGQLYNGKNYIYNEEGTLTKVEGYKKGIYQQ